MKMVVYYSLPAYILSIPFGMLPTIVNEVTPGDPVVFQFLLGCYSEPEPEGEAEEEAFNSFWDATWLVSHIWNVVNKLSIPFGMLQYRYS